MKENKESFLSFLNIDIMVLSMEFQTVIYLTSTQTHLKNQNIG